MIVTRAPYRISFFGGGSDLESFYSQSPGAVLSTTINKFTYVSSHYFFDTDKIRIKYSKTETKTAIDDIEHPIVREVLRKFRVRGAIEISSNGDVVAGSGLGSSSAFTVAMLLNMYARAGKFVDKQRLAEEACDIEINRLGEPIGKQDQYASAYGGLNVIRFDTSGQTTVETVHLNKPIFKDLQSRLLMFHTGQPRQTSSILAEQRDNMKVPKKFDIVRRMVDLVWVARESLYAGELHRFGELLHLNWRLKRQLASYITNPEIDGLYDRGIDAGAVGGKLLGAGGSGFLLFYCEPEHQQSLRNAMASCRELVYKLDYEGSKVLFVADEYWDHDQEALGLNPDGGSSG
jgi:D-glycero-alpha-D-manno-heptose-7-phosphate kinase